MATRKGKNKRKVKSTEHVLASTTFEDPFARKRTFTQINASAGPSATTHSARVSMTVGREPTTKRVRVEAPSQAEATNEGLKRKEKETGEKTRTQASVLLEQFESHLEGLLDYILDSEIADDLHELCNCGQDQRVYQCSDCLQPETLCAKCFISRHRLTPFHWAEKWNGKFFERHDLADLGQSVYLGHHGNQCPNIGPGNVPIDFTTVDTNGIHKIKLFFCACPGGGNRLHQLMKAELFPASTSDPTCAFTFRVLHDFHLHTLESKKSAYDYLNALRRLSDNANPDRISLPYAQFLRVVRVWRMLTMRKRTGQAHGIDEYLPNRPKGSMVTSCPACPEPGFNMEDDWELIEEDMKHVIQLFLALDGNFKLKKKKKNDDPDDVALMDGLAYFPKEASFQEYLAAVGPSKEKSTCAYLNAVNLQDKLKFKNCDITGVINAECHHVYILSMIDLQLGERYANADFALAMALRRGLIVKYIVVTYDIACQYGIGIVERFRQRFPDLVDVVSQIVFLVPKLHLQAHKDDCQYRYSLNYAKNVGRNHGEGIESGWAARNEEGGSTSEMNGGHRHNTLDDTSGDWNWKKTVRMSQSLYKRLTNSLGVSADKRDHFVGLTSTLPKGFIAEWEELSDEPEFKSGEWTSVYRHKRVKVPSQSSVFQDMLGHASKRSENADEATGITTFLNKGLKIQSRQRLLRSKVARFKKHSLAHAEQEINDERTRIRAEILRWRREQRHLMPKVADLVLATKSKQVEDEVLYLPSDLSAERASCFGYLFLASEELRLREGEAHDALRDLRATIKYKRSLNQHRRDHVRKQGPVTRAKAIIDDAAIKVQNQVEKYRGARQALINLGRADDGSFPALNDEDTYTKDTMAPHVLGDGNASRTEGWIWRVGPLGKMSEEEYEDWQKDVDRVRWFRARADVHRWQEDVEMAEAEFRRTIRSFEKLAWIWENLAGKHKRKGYQAYGYRQSSMYTRMATTARAKYAAAGGSWPAVGESTMQHLRRLRVERGFLL